MWSIVVVGSPNGKAETYRLISPRGTRTEIEDPMTLDEKSLRIIRRHLSKAEMNALLTAEGQMKRGGPPEGVRTMVLVYQRTIDALTKLISRKQIELNEARNRARASFWAGLLGSVVGASAVTVVILYLAGER
jgi:hypothetical protein